MDKRDEQAIRLDEIERELQKAMEHARIAASHWRSREVPRACAHTFAIQGHISYVSALISKIAEEHRLHARTDHP